MHARMCWDSCRVRPNTLPTRRGRAQGPAHGGSYNAEYPNPKSGNGTRRESKREALLRFSPTHRGPLPPQESKALCALGLETDAHTHTQCGRVCMTEGEREGRRTARARARSSAGRGGAGEARRLTRAGACGDHRGYAESPAPMRAEVAAPAGAGLRRGCRRAAAFGAHQARRLAAAKLWTEAAARPSHGSRLAW